MKIFSLQWICTLLVATTLVGCGKKKKSFSDDDDDTSPKPSLIKDWERISELANNPLPSDMANLDMHGNLHDLKAWIDERVNYIVPDMSNRQLAQYIVSNTTTASLSSGTENALVRVMSNLGAGLMGSKFVGQSFVLDDGIRVNLGETPRVGLLMVGPGLYKNKINTKNPGALGNSLSRLQTLAHEARHSDGRGKDQAFSHTFCPSGHTYEGSPACDKDINGPYTVDYKVMMLFEKACSSSGCSSRDRKNMKLEIADGMSRVTGSSVGDGTPIKLYTPPFSEAFREY